MVTCIPIDGKVDPSKIFFLFAEGNSAPSSSDAANFIRVSELN
jgi:hypothetical protein